MAPTVSVSAFSHCETIVREHEPDRYWASLFAPADKRPYLQALYAFNHAVACVRESVSAPLPGEIRLQWWRDVIDAAQSGAQGDPVSEALIATITRFSLPVQAFHDLIDARVFDLYDDPMPSLADLEGYCGETSSALFRLASIVLADGRDPGGADAAGHAGVAHAMTGLLRALPWHLRRGQVYLPADVLERHGVSRESLTTGAADGPGLSRALADLRAVARDHFTKAETAMADVAPEARAAFLAAATVPAYLARMEQRGYTPSRSIIDLPQWRRLWAFWRTAGRWGR
ncbi:phytoene/squalene synthase family protein [Pseudochelatococcus lubricantis]|uniref:phytoene/squalene synthase family protein n=1 Tax=Pseudochelatococcus lubricantis TaxID=1538102 RepID=UPI0035EECEA0